MPQASPRFHEFRGARSYPAKFDICVLLVFVAFAFSLIVGPLTWYLSETTTTYSLDVMMQARSENRYFWPALAGVALVLALRDGSRIARLTWPPHLIGLLACLMFAGASILWAFKPDVSFTKFASQMTIIISIVIPAMLAGRTADLMRALFLCVAITSILNIYFVLSNPPRFGTDNMPYYTGYMTDKNLLGQVEAIALLLALHEALYPGLRRALGIFIGAVSVVLLVLSESKTSLALAILVPVAAKIIFIIKRKTRVSPAIIVLSVALGYVILSAVAGITVNKLSWYIYGNYTLSARTEIWDFVNAEIARRPFLGWGYQSFWLVGPDGPSVVDAWGWIKFMPHAHNGYLDTKLDGGIVGLGLLLIFVFATLHAIGRVSDENRAWLVLSLVLFVIVDNFLETSWMRSNVVWMVFVLVAVEVARYCQYPPPGATSGTEALRPPRPFLNNRKLRSTIG